MSDTSKQGDWTKPAAMAIPKGGFFKDKLSKADTARSFPRLRLATASPSSRRSSPDGSRSSMSTPRTSRRPWPVSRMFSPCSSCITSDGTSSTSRGKPTSNTWAFSTPTSTNTPRMLLAFAASGLITVFENLEGFPKDWKTNAPAFIKFVRDHHRPSFLEYGEYPFVSADEIKKALKLKAAFSNMLDQMQ